MIFARLVEDDGRLSLTNLGMLIALGKIILLRGASLPDLTTLLAMLGAYYFKSHSRRSGVLADHVEKVNEVAAAVDSVKAKVLKIENRGKV